MLRLESIRDSLNQRLGRKGQYVKRELITMIGEYVGTTMFLIMAYGATNIANLPSSKSSSANNTSNLLFIAIAFGFSILVNIWLFFRVSGGLFNPAVSLALALARVISPLRAILLFISQLLGGITAAALVSVLTPGPLRVSNRLAGGISVSQGLFLEMFATSLLILSIFMLAVEKTKSTFVAPVGIGLALFVGHLSNVYWTGAGLNPARSFGPNVVTASFPTYDWIYWIGPFLGAFVSTGFYMTLKLLDYEDANGTADRDETALRKVEMKKDYIEQARKTAVGTESSDSEDRVHVPMA